MRLPLAHPDDLAHDRCGGSAIVPAFLATMESAVSMHAQRCPNCRERNDVSVYVHGQLARCARCGLRFTVERSDAGARSADARPVSTPDGVTEFPTDVSQLRGGAPGAEPEAVPMAVEVDQQAADAPTRVATVDQRPAAPRPRSPENLQGQAVPEIPGYQCLELLGRGGMGEVWKARQKSLDRVVAIKILSPTLAVEPDFVRRFERESSALAALAHPHVVAVYDRGSANGHWYFVMEFVEGRSLRDRAAEGRLTRQDLLRLSAQTARAVDYAHTRGVIHRDLKPENILVDHAGNAKVADFGLAGMSEHGRSSLTMTAVAMGTAHYMAPEQRRDAKNVDGRADLYSLGVMLYELITNELPVGRFATPREKVPDTDPSLDEMVLRLLEQDPAKRPDRASEVAELLESLAAGNREEPRKSPPQDLESALAALPRAPLRDPPPRSAESFVRVALSTPRKRWLVAAAAGVLALIVAVSVASTGPSVSTKEWLAVGLEKEKDKEATLVFGAGDPKALQALGTGWDVEEGVLVRDDPSAALPGSRQTRAVLQTVLLDSRAAAVEADVIVEESSLGGSEAPPSAEVVLYADAEKQVALRMSLAEDAGFRFHSLPAVKQQPKAQGKVDLPEAGRKYRLQIFLRNTQVTASVDGKSVYSVSMSALDNVPLKAVLGCTGRCQFTQVRLLGQLSEPPAPTTAARK